MRVEIKPPGDRRFWSLVPFLPGFHFGYAFLTHSHMNEPQFTDRGVGGVPLQKWSDSPLNLVREFTNKVGARWGPLQKWFDSPHFTQNPRHPTD